ncbi:MAG: class I SAM-dependent methyltransferase [Candidatus Nanoarchaeia archaeon]|nr:class I SAM-dependent methyltransferase [Candidatus Nanoarchaeia archaeon]
MRYYNAISKSYNELHKKEQLNKINIIKENIKPKKDEILLDVGCGTGISTSSFNCIKIGVDPSIKMLKQAKNAFYMKACAEKLPFKDRCFDYVISVTAVHNFKDIKKGLEEIKRVAKKDVVLSVMKRSSKFGEIEKRIISMFKVKKIIEEEKDIIFFLKR